MDTVDSVNDKIGSTAKGFKCASKGYKIKLPVKGANVVNIIDKNAGRVVNGVHKGEWILRVDGPHRGATYNHININEAVSGIKDPHLPISQGTLEVSFVEVNTFYVLIGDLGGVTGDKFYFSFFSHFHNRLQ